MIRMNDFTSEPEELRRQELAAVERVFRSGSFILGSEVRQFEEAWANFCDTKFCVGVANGMESIELGLRALSIGPGDEVVTTPMTAIATILAIMHAGATPVLADIDPATGFTRCGQCGAVPNVTNKGVVASSFVWTGARDGTLGGVL